MLIWNMLGHSFGAGNHEGMLESWKHRLRPLRWVTGYGYYICLKCVIHPYICLVVSWLLCFGVVHKSRCGRCNESVPLFQVCSAVFYTYVVSVVLIYTAVVRFVFSFIMLMLYKCGWDVVLVWELFSFTGITRGIM